jgi:hypothetical protein
MSPDFRAHPEFGYFCLSQKFRRKARNVLASSVAVGMVAGALALWARDNPGDDALTIVRVNEVPANIDAVPTVEQATAATTAQRSGPPAGVKAAACDGDNWTYADGKCVMRRAQRPGSLAAATDSPQIAAVPADPNAPPAPVAASPATKREDATVAARKTEPAPTELIGPSAPMQKAERKPPRSQIAGREANRMNSGSRDGRVREAQRSARSYASSDDRPRQMPAQNSPMKWARQLQECIGAVRCRAGEQLLRTLMSGSI